MEAQTVQKKLKPTVMPGGKSRGRHYEGQHANVQSILHGSRIQPKLRVGQPNDKYEQEADRVAEQVMRMPVSQPGSFSSADNPPPGNSNPHSGTIQRACAACAKDEAFIQAKTADGVIPEITPTMGTGIQSLQSGGQPLSKSERSFFEPRIGADFSNVRVHNDMRAARVAQSINARAFTHGNNVVFGAGEYSPNTAQGRKLLAHELTHTLQQNGTVDQKIQRTLGDGHDLLAERFQGRLDLEAAFDNESFIRKGSAGPDVVILQLALLDAGQALPNFGADGDFGSETKSAVVAFQRANGLQDDGVVGPITMEALDAIFTIGPVIAPVCNNPGIARTLTLQPVFFRDNASDPDPTGNTFFTQLSKANEIWSKLGVTFTTNSPVFLNDSVHKIQGASVAEVLAIGGLRTGGGIEVYFVDNDMLFAGGGATRIGLGASFVVLSDFGTSATLLAHELGHALSNSIGHPPANGEAGTIMEPSNSHSTLNPERNTIGNLAFIVFPAGTDPICLTPDP